MKSIFLLGLALSPLGVLRAQSVAPTPEKPVPPTLIERKAESNKPGGIGAVQNFAPLKYFDANCARCHGPNGSFYGANFGKTLKDDAALRQIVKEMCEGPANAPINEKSLEILTDFHRALRDNAPFLVLVSQNEKTLSGEASPDAKLTLENGTQSIAIQQKGNDWTLDWPADFSKTGAKIVARRGEKSREILL